jgi:hypothetical protein
MVFRLGGSVVCGRRRNRSRTGAPPANRIRNLLKVAASIYAVTGWEADKVARVANEALRDRPSEIGKFKTMELTPGLYLEIEQVGFDIFLEKPHQQAPKQ